MAKASWCGETIAESDETKIVDGYTYFPPQTVRWDLLRATAETTVCSTKGTASYFDIVVGPDHNESGAWIYKTPLPRATDIAGWIGFWRGVKIER